MKFQLVQQWNQADLSLRLRLREKLPNFNKIELDKNKKKQSERSSITLVFASAGLFFKFQPLLFRVKILFGTYHGTVIN